VWNTKAREEAIESKSSDSTFAQVGSIMVYTGVTPCRKRKSVYNTSISPSDEIPALASSSSLSSPGSSFDFDLVSIPMNNNEEDEEWAPEDKVNNTVGKWNHLITNVNRMAALFKHLRVTLGDDMDLLQDKIAVVDSKIGVKGTFSSLKIV
jgi:hypothetical protein